MKYQCPVCGFSELPRPAEDHLICPCCGTQFGYHDCATSHDELRRNWIAEGARWHSRVHPAPHNWNSSDQLAN
ncbi:MAG TPA: hypothetical protein VMT64_01220, partial [Candidatus Binataceae bacterium]|nr:hypothetical protein [Candidatus Binataceae bacterium]